jgi:pimeloyl-ACP methyl ester carboxylesterase
MTVGRHRCAAALMALVTCGVVCLVGVGAPSAGAAPERTMEAIAEPGPGGTSRASSGGAGLSLPRPTGRHPVGVRTTFVLDAARAEPATGGPRAIPVRVWYPAKRRDGPSAPYFSASVQAAIEQGIGVPAGLFDIDTHATRDALARRHVRGVLLFTGGFATPVALYTGVIIELASRGYTVVAFDHPHETFVVEQPDGSLIAGDLADDAGPGRACLGSPSPCPVFEARLSDVGVVLGALAALVPAARPRTPIGIFGHSNGGAAAAVAIVRHPQIRAGVNLDGFVPAELITAGLDRPFGLMLGLDQRPEELRDIEIFLSNMRAPHAVRSLDIHHYGFSDFVVFNPQAQQADPTLGSALEATFFTGTLDSLRAGLRALTRQRRFLARFFDRHLESGSSGASPPALLSPGREQESRGTRTPLLGRASGPGVDRPLGWE